ncbi:MAG TPA: sugar porter family MFS transporter [Bryobacteraceae bacterium]|nr:sugar porter family MFS transporter [Bryobacteraceae bacterium]
MTLSGSLVKSTIVAALGGLLFGFDTAVIAGTTQGLTRSFALSNTGLGVAVSSALIGTIFGALFAQMPADRLGRRNGLRLMAILYVLSSLGCAFAPGWYVWLFFRVIGGLGIGGSSVLGPMYIAEISPAKWRGRLVGFFQFNVVAGILLAYLSNFLIREEHFPGTEWRWMLGVAGVPALLFLIMLYFIPESPRWLAQKGRTAEARETLVAIGEENVDAELQDILQSIHLEQGGTEPLFQPKYRLPIFLGVSIATFNQFSGINAILYYLNDIFARAGFNQVSSDLQAVLIGLTNLVFTMLAMSIIDRVGRKTLLLIGSVGMAVSLAAVAIIFLSGSHEGLLVWCLVSFIAFFAFSQGAVIWVFISEIFPTRVRAKGQSLGTFTHWFLNAAISLAFPVIAGVSRGAPFVLFAVMMVVQFFVVLAMYPETKGRTLEEMQHALGID